MNATPSQPPAGQPSSHHAAQTSAHPPAHPFAQGPAQRATGASHTAGATACPEGQAVLAANQPRPSVQTTSTMLRIGVRGPARPVDELLARLEAAEGAAWLSAALANAARLAGVPVSACRVALLAPAATPTSGSIERMLCEGAATVTQLEMLKDHGKRMLKSAVTPDDRSAALAAYFFSIAAALKHHDTLIGARRAGGDHGPRDELHDALLDLASATNQPWTSMLGEAALRTKQT